MQTDPFSSENVVSRPPSAALKAVRADSLQVLRQRQLSERFPGRLITVRGRMHFVVSVDNDAGLAEVSCGDRGTTRSYLMPITELRYWLVRDREFY